MKILFFISFLIFHNLLLAQGKKAQIKALSQKIITLESIINDQNVMIREQFTKLQNENEQILSKLTVIQLTTDSILTAQNVGINLNNGSSLPFASDNPFGDGGNGGGGGGGDRPTFGEGTGGEGYGFGDGKTRIRINDPLLPKYNTDVDLIIHLKLTVSGDGNVTNAVFIKSKSTTTDQTIISDVIRQVIRQVKYNKDANGRVSYCFLTVKVNAQ